MPSRILFGAFALDAETGELWKRGRKVKLPPKPARVLMLLAGSPGQLFTRETLRHRIWGEDTFVDFEHGLNFCIRAIRSVLGDHAKKPRYIETLPRRGYRFIAATASSAEPPPTAGPNGLGSLHGSSSEARRIAACEHYARARRSFT